MKYVTNGIVEIVKITLYLYAFYLAWDLGIIDGIMNYFR